MPTQFIVYTPDLEQSGQHNTIQAHPETEISLWATLLNTLMRQADSAAHTGRGVGVTARYHNFILPLPAQLLTVIVTESDARTLHAGKHAQAYTQTYCTCNTHQNTQDWVKGGASTLLLDVTHCQVAGWVLSIELTKIKILATKKKKKRKSGNVSLSIWVRQREEVHDAEGSPPSFMSVCICLHLVYLSWHRNKVMVSRHKCLYDPTYNVRQQIAECWSMGINNYVIIW